MMESLSFYIERSKLYVQLPKNLRGEEIIDALLILNFVRFREDIFFISLKERGLAEQNKLLLRLKSYLDNKKYICDWDQKSKAILDDAEETKENFKIVGSIAKSLLEKNNNKGEFFSQEFKRKLKKFQEESVNHLINLPFAANFSVPGSGKTTIVYAAYSKLKERGEVNKLLIVGPSPVYLAWQEEFYQCFGTNPNLVRIIGEISKRKKIYENGEKFEIFVITYQMLANDILKIQELLKRNNFLVVLDESHYIKNFQEGKWVSAVLDIAPYAKRKIILTGTPVPNNLLDLWSQFTFLDPSENILGSRNIYKKNVDNYDNNLIGEKLLPYYRRIKKDDLNLPIPNFKIIKVNPKPLQKKIYNIIRRNILSFTGYNLREKKYLREIQKAKIVRLMQVASNPKLISGKSEEFDVSPLCQQRGIQDLDNKIKKIIKDHKAEDSAKVECTEKLTRFLVKEGKKVLIWTPWISNIKLLEDQLKNLNPVTIWGDIPLNEEDYPEDNRELRINEFKTNPNVKVLIANPGACGESISLHTVCHDAIYMDRTFNGAQFMQSMDRIHRVGLTKEDKINYYILLTKGTIDETIHRRLNEKISRMYEILKDDFNPLNLESSIKDISDLKEDEELDYISILKDLRESKNDT